MVAKFFLPLELCEQQYQTLRFGKLIRIDRLANHRNAFKACVEVVQNRLKIYGCGNKTNPCLRPSEGLPFPSPSFFMRSGCERFGTDSPIRTE
jgi:hypothetical protein